MPSEYLKAMAREIEAGKFPVNDPQRAARWAREIGREMQEVVCQRQEIDRLRAELAERHNAVPDGWDLWRDENGDIRLDDLKHDLHIMVPSYYAQHGDLWLKVVGGLLDAMLTVAPEARSEAEIQAEALGRVRAKATELAANSGPSARNAFEAINDYCDSEAARLREGA